MLQSHLHKEMRKFNKLRFVVGIDKPILKFQSILGKIFLKSLENFAHQMLNTYQVAVVKVELTLTQD